MVVIKWNYIAIMRDPTEFSILSSDLLKKKAKLNRICIGLVREINLNEDFILKEIESAEIKGIVVFGNEDTVRSISRNKNLGNFRFIFVSNENLHSGNTKKELPNSSIQLMWNGFDNKMINNGTLKYINDAVHMALNWFSICQNLSNCRDLQQQEIIKGTLKIYQKVKDKHIQVINMIIIFDCSQFLWKAGVGIKRH